MLAIMRSLQAVSGFLCNNLNADGNSHDNKNNVTALMVDDKKNSVLVDTDVAELDEDTKSSQNGAAHKDHNCSPNDENKMTQNERKSKNICHRRQEQGTRRSRPRFWQNGGGG
jgi:hypothetical protein